MTVTTQSSQRLVFMRVSLFLALLVLFSLPRPAIAKNFSTVVIDPGHGGNDKGSNWYGIYEKNLTLDLAKRVHRILQSKGVPVVLTRSTDTYVALDKRAAIANRNSHFVFVSIHFNGHKNTSYRGIETFYYPGSSKGKKLAGKIQHELGTRIKTKNRGIKSARLKVLRLTKGPAVLIECGFLSNRWENKRCNASWLREIIAEEIVQGIMAYR
ncbi:MAG: N-acetylmuramoyl-L-alanine amidase [Verrucomicrobiota bacterium]